MYLGVKGNHIPLHCGDCGKSTEENQSGTKLLQREILLSVQHPQYFIYMN